MTNESDRPRETRTASDFAEVERGGAEAMARRPVILDEDGRRVTDPGQEQRAPEERPTVRQALFDEESRRRGPDGRGAPR